MDELLERKSAVTVTVEKLNESKRLWLRDVVARVVSQEVYDFVAGNRAVHIAVDSFES